MPVPPRVPAEPSVSPGILEKPVLTTGSALRQPICRACPIRLIGVRIQMRLKAALPESKMRPVSFSRYDTTLGGDIQPIQCLGPLPCPNRRRIVHADGPIRLDDPPTSCGDLPLQGIAGQRFSSIALPHVTPEVLFAFGALTLPGCARPCSRVRPMSGEDEHSRISARDPFDIPGPQAER